MSLTAVARAVGDRSWRSWAGRTNGKRFELSDIFRGSVRALRWSLISSAPGGKACPVCFDIMGEDGSASWHRLWCGCFVCHDCFSRWVRSALDGAAPVVADQGDEAADQPLISLSCPACSAPLRRCDAEAVLARDSALLEDYDSKLRDLALRGMPSFRPCPQCAGGGYIDWACISSRRLEAQREARHWACAAYALVVAAGCAGLLRKLADTGRVTVLSFLLIGAYFLADKVRHTSAAAVADVPLEVGCPECAHSFALPGAGDALADAAAASPADDAWVRENTRPCPRASCRAPILKHGGCNAMRCGRCRLDFCWACMQPRGRCGHFKCANGAPFGNAAVWQPAAAADGDELQARAVRTEHFARWAALLAYSWAASALLVLVLKLLGSEGGTASSDAARFVDSLYAQPLLWPCSTAVRVCSAAGDMLASVWSVAWPALKSLAICYVVVSFFLRAQLGERRVPWWVHEQQRQQQQGARRRR